MNFEIEVYKTKEVNQFILYGVVNRSELLSQDDNEIVNSDTQDLCMALK